MATVEQVIARLKEKARPDNLEGMQRFGMTKEGRLGLSMPEMRALAKELGKDHSLALELWKTGIAEARIIAALIDDPKLLTERQMEAWVKDFNSWDVCDQVCGELFDKSPLAWEKVVAWSDRNEEFVKRAAFALLASLAWHDKKADDERFIELLPVIVQASTDERNFVRKAVNWALRNIGKRNIRLNKAAIDTAFKIQKLDTKAARWIASDAIRELESEAVRKRLEK
ncbi:MAG TPA: DNA alkylation repair protein [Dehalococcoidales bacterium]